MSNKTCIKFDLNKYFLQSVVILVFILVLNYGSYLINIINLIENLVPNSLKINKPPVKLRVDKFYL